MVFDDGLPALPEEVQKRILAIYVRDHVARQAATCTAARHLLSHDAPYKQLLHQKDVMFTLYVVFHGWYGVQEVDLVTRVLWGMKHTARSLKYMEDLLVMLKGDVVDREITDEEESELAWAFSKACFMFTKKENITTSWRDIPKNICFTLSAATIAITGAVAAVVIDLAYQVLVRL